MAIDDESLQLARAKVATWAEQGRDKDRLYDGGEYVDFDRWGGTLDSQFSTECLIAIVEWATGCTVRLEPAPAPLPEPSEPKL